MENDFFARIASLLLLLAVLSARALLEDSQQEERYRLFGYLDAIVRSVEVLNKQRIDRDTTRTSNETITSLLKESNWFNHSRDDDALLNTLRVYLEDAPIVHGVSVLDASPSPLDPDRGTGILSYYLTGDSPIPTRIWFTSTDGYGSAMLNAAAYILLIPTKGFREIYLSDEPILLDQAADGSIYSLSIPSALKPLLNIWKTRPKNMATFLSEKSSRFSPGYPDKLIEKGKELLRLHLSPVIEMMTYEQLRSEIVRLAAVKNDKSYSTQQVDEALRDSLKQEHAEVDLFGIKFSREVFALVFPIVYAFAGFSVFQATRSSKITRKSLRARDAIDLSTLLLTFAVMFLSVLPITLATIHHASFLTATGLPEVPNASKLTLVLAPLLVGTLFLGYGLIREARRVIHAMLRASVASS